MRRVGMVVLVVAGVFGAFVVPVELASASALHHQTQVVPVTGQVNAVSLRDDVGDLSVVPGAATTIRVVEQYNYAAPVITHTVTNGVLSVTASCPSTGIIALGLNSCSVDLSLTVPQSVAVHATDSVGDISVRGLHGNEALRTDVGDVRVDRVIAPTVSAATSAGTVRLMDVRAGALSLRSATGDLVASLAATPRSVVARCADGDVDLSLPSGTYAVDVHSDVGNTHVHGITVSSDAPRTLTASSDEGDVRIVGR